MASTSTHILISSTSRAPTKVFVLLPITGTQSDRRNLLFAPDCYVLYKCGVHINNENVRLYSCEYTTQTKCSTDIVLMSKNNEQSTHLDTLYVTRL